MNRGMAKKTRLGQLRPLFFGRLTRIIFGLISIYLAIHLGSDELGLAGMFGLVFLGVSFLVGGLMGNPGCELSALLNLILPAKKRVTFP